MNNTIPKEAADFIFGHFARCNAPLSPSMHGWIKTGNASISSLKVSQLKILWNGLDQVHRQYAGRYPQCKPRPSSKKDVWVEAIRSLLYIDFNGTVNPRMISALSALGSRPLLSTPTSATAAAAADATRDAAAMSAAMSLRISAAEAAAVSAALQSRPMLEIPRPSSSLTSNVASLPSPSYSSKKKKSKKLSCSASRRAWAIRNAASARAAQKRSAQSYQNPSLPVIDSMPHPAHLNGATSSFAQLPAGAARHTQPHPSHCPAFSNGHAHHGRATSRQGYSIGGGSSPTIKTEGANYDSHPQTPQEVATLSRLRQMGFTDQREMMMGIRHVQQQQQNGAIASDDMFQAETAMIWIVSQREEAEEARKLDLARRSSELCRAERAEKRKAQKRQELLDATVEDLEKRYFVGSGLLKQCRPLLEKTTRPEVLRLLQLEKDAYKWYGTVAPFCYFCRVIDNLKKSPTLEQMKTESTKLEKIMFTLSEQQGGVPRPFLDAQRDAKEKGLPQAPHPIREDAESDGEVIVMDEEEVKKLPSASSEKENRKKKDNSKKNGVSASMPEVIELL